MTTLHGYKYHYVTNKDRGAVLCTNVIGSAILGAAGKDDVTCKKCLKLMTLWKV